MILKYTYFFLIDAICQDFYVKYLYINPSLIIQYIFFFHIYLKQALTSQKIIRSIEVKKMIK